jgi:hypothetical protein
MKHTTYSQVDETVQTPRPAYSDRQFLHTYQSAAFVPLTQSTINAVMVMILTGVVLYLFDAIDYVKPMLVAGALMWVGSWLYFQRRWLNLTELESRLQIDLNNDGFVGDPQEVKQVRVQIDKLENNGHIRSAQMFTLPCSDVELEDIAQGVKRGIPFSEKEWTGKDNPFSVNRFREIRSEMIKRGMLVPASAKSDKQGYVFTRAGQAVLDHYVPSPTPLDDEA